MATTTSIRITEEQDTMEQLHMKQDIPLWLQCYEIFSVQWDEKCKL